MTVHEFARRGRGNTGSRRTHTHRMHISDGHKVQKVRAIRSSSPPATFRSQSESGILDTGPRPSSFHFYTRLPFVDAKNHRLYWIPSWIRCGTRVGRSRTSQRVTMNRIVFSFRVFIWATPRSPPNRNPWPLLDSSVPKEHGITKAFNNLRNSSTLKRPKNAFKIKNLTHNIQKNLLKHW